MLDRQSRRTQLADSHLVYIPAAITPTDAQQGERARYDVYHRDGGFQLGWVVKFDTHWEAHSFSEDEALDRTRWEAACGLWGTA